MRATILVALALAACGGSVDCPAGAVLDEADADCDCAGEEYALQRGGEICTCEEDGLVCDAGDSGDPEPTETTGGCRGVDCD